ncbi:ATP-binding cassette sub-family G member 1 isoform X2 [Ostrinia furnacalis]|uniref:ATP-binding cassette sub-family G member 1 isoform X1 n=1 Tax=Ostrinia furnacalis TaxID=93504 RepID=UPI00103B5D5C|nr:ATP-binding cassette sub-family G member 1 isoform X1 [Ostrinia furnacalis]XP_028163842.1 ATP-binding cassette sub-family G member 1 isoform X2 [Ostrinia furnacalis]
MSDRSMGASRLMGRDHLSHLPQRPPVNLSFQDLTYTVTNGKRSKIILRSINGEFRSGQLTAILGPSGAGKSTLLNILAGYRVNGASGMICTNGEPRNLKQFRKLSRYIMQEDLLQPFITVHEAMLIAADLKLGTGINKQKKLVIVEEIVQLLRLAKARNTATERLSGGERKRLSIALELLNNPPVIFLDEPTTGLDDVASSTCVSLLKRVARGGRTVVCSLHTPSARLFAEFDHVYVVADGRCAYQGTSGGVVPFLNELQLPCPTTYNPADFIIEVSSGEYGPHADRMVAAVENGRCQRWRDFAADEVVFEDLELEQLNAGGVVEKHSYKHGSTACEQFLVLLRRMLLQTVRNKGYLWLRVGLHLFLGFIVALLFFQMGYDASKTIFNFGFCYACIIAMLYIPMMPVLLAFPKEVQLVKREYFNRWYGLKPYYAALVVSRTPATIFFSLIYLGITYPLTSQPMELPRVLMFTAICIMVALISESMGTVISSMLSVVNSVFLGPALSVPLMLLAVYGIGYGDVPPPIVWKLARSCSFLRYGIEGLVAAIYGPPREDLICPDHVDYCEYKNVNYFIKLMGMSGVSFWADFGVLTLMLLGMNLAGYYLLRQRLSPNYAFRAIKVIGSFIKTKMSGSYH